MKKFSATIAMPLVIWSCSTTNPPHYSIPDPDQAAELELITDRTPDQGGAFIYQDGENCRGISRINIGAISKIRSNEVTTFFIGGGRTLPNNQKLFCRMNISFTAEPKARYVAAYALEENICRVIVVKKAQRAYERDSSVRAIAREYKAPFLESGSFCGAEIKQ